MSRFSVLLGSLLVPAVVLAAPQQAPEPQAESVGTDALANQDSVALYPHVRVERSPIPVTESAVDSLDANAGLRVYIDPVTGRITSSPSDKQRAELDREILAQQNPDADVLASREGLVQEVLPGGAVKIRLDERFHSLVTVEVDAEGNRSTACTDELHAALGDHAHSAEQNSRDDR